MEILDDHIMQQIKQHRDFQISLDKYKKEPRSEIRLNVITSVAFIVVLIVFSVNILDTLFSGNVDWTWAEIVPLLLPFIIMAYLFLLSTGKRLFKITKEYKNPQLHIHQDTSLKLRSAGYQNYIIHLEEEGEQEISLRELRSFPTNTPIYCIRWGDSKVISDIYRISEINLGVFRNLFYS